MTYFTFSIYDSKAKNYHIPYNLKNEAVAVREFADIVNDPKSSIYKHPEDYTLFKIGTWDDHDAKFKLESTPKSLAKGVELKIDVI